MRRMTTALVGAASAAVLTFTVAGCSDDSSQARESKTRQGGYDKLAKRQPAGTMDYSPTRETINKWIKTWEQPGKLSYVYLQNGRGEYGYFVLKGLPVSYCAMLTPPQKVDSSSNGKVTVDQPGMDGAYYSGQQCNSYYGTDATTGAYVEFTVGQNQSYFLYDAPMKLPQFKSAQPMGPSTINEARNSR